MCGRGRSENAHTRKELTRKKIELQTNVFVTLGLLSNHVAKLLTKKWYNVTQRSVKHHLQNAFVNAEIGVADRNLLNTHCAHNATFLTDKLTVNLKKDDRKN